MHNKINVINSLIKNKIIAIVRSIENDKVINVARALYDGGIRMLEVTFNTEGAAEMIKTIKDHLGNDILVGAGTVLDSETAKTAIDVGAEFILSPSLDKDTITICNRYGVLPIPGITTPTEAVKAMQWGAEILKFFPAGVLGPDYVRNILGPLNHSQIIAVGGINRNNASDFLSAGCIGLGVGGALVNNNLIAENNYKTIKERAEDFLKLI